MKRFIYSVCVGLVAVTAPLIAYNFEFKNLTSKDLVIEMLLGGGIGEKPEQITVPAMTQDSSGKIKPGVASKWFGGLQVGLCLSKNDLKIGEKGQPLKKIMDEGGIKLIDNTPCSNLLIFTCQTPQETLAYQIDHPEGFDSFLKEKGRKKTSLWWRNMQAIELLICYDRTFAIVEFEGKLTLVTWE